MVQTSRPAFWGTSCLKNLRVVSAAKRWFKSGQTMVQVTGGGVVPIGKNSATPLPPGPLAPWPVLAAPARPRASRTWRERVAQDCASVRTSRRATSSRCSAGVINFEEGQITRMIGQTHPYGWGPIPPSAADFQMLRDLGQQHSYVVNGGGQIIRIRR